MSCFHIIVSPSYVVWSNGFDEKQKDDLQHGLMCVVSLFDKEYDFVVRSNILNTMCEAQYGYW